LEFVEFQGAVLGNRSLRLLVVDDEWGICFSLKRFFERRGHVVETAADTAAARGLLAEGSFDAVMVDRRLPGDGLQLALELDQSEALRNRVLLLTGDARVEGALQWPRPDRLIRKPFDYDQLALFIERITDA
jgi:two-component system, OmpR family, response regulator